MTLRASPHRNAGFECVLQLAVRGRMGIAPWLRYASGGAIAAAVAVGALLVSHPVQNPDAVPAGRLLFDDHCAECHGATANGSKKAPSLRVPEVQAATPGTLLE